LLTTHEVSNIEKAIECISWYKKRWFIEELFRVIKTKGFQIESSQLASGLKLKKLLAMTIEAALHIMKLKLSLADDECLAKTIFSKEEEEFIEVLQAKVEGNTQKQKNPYPKNSLAWAAWTIARIAGWTGYGSHGPPGYITIKDGYDRFHLQFEGYLLFKNKT
ncbi:MAG: IS4 family transposase, partial [Fluviicola sp.]